MSGEVAVSVRHREVPLVLVGDLASRGSPEIIPGQKSHCVGNVVLHRSTPEIRRPHKPHEREVGVSSLWPRARGVLQEHGMGVFRQLDRLCPNFRIARYAGAICKENRVR